MDEEVQHEVFENQRLSPTTRDWGGAFPSHLTASDPPSWSNRVHQPIHHDGTAEHGRPMRSWPCRPGWEWLGDWRVDTLHAHCDTDGWRYAASFDELQQSLLAHSPSGAGGMREESGQQRLLPTRWRRWTRLRRRVKGDAGTALRVLKSPASDPPLAEGSWREESVGGSRAGSGWEAEEIGEASIICEGWLARWMHGRWSNAWCLLVNPPDPRRLCARLLYTSSLESGRVSEELISPPLPFSVTSRPRVPRELALLVTPAHLDLCFAVGSDRPAEGLLHCAPTKDELRRWLAAFTAVERRIAARHQLLTPASVDQLPGSATVPGELCILVLGATGLAATERDGTTDPYVSVTVKGGRRTMKKKTAVVKGSVRPVWDTHLSFLSVCSHKARPCRRRARACMHA